MAWTDFFLKPAEPAATTDKRPRPAQSPSSVDQAQQPSSNPSPSNWTGQLPVSNSFQTPPQLDPRFVQHFEEILDKANVPGPDFYEFQKQMKNMRSLGLSDVQLYPTVFQNLLSFSQGMSAPDLLRVLNESAELYIQTVEADKVQFQQNSAARFEEKVGGLNKEIAERQKQSEDAIAQITLLQNTIAENSEKLIQLQGQVQIQSQKIEETQRNYEYAQTQLVDGIKHMSNNIKQFVVLQ